MVRRPLSILLLACLLLAAAGPATATNYLFELPSMEIDLWPQTDGKLHVRYQITFRNTILDPLDVVDIGTPNAKFDLASFRASLTAAQGNVHSLTDIRQSTQVTGAEVWLTGHEIKKGETATLSVEFTQPRMVWYDQDDENYTSVEFGNTYFGSEYVRGTMELTVRWHFPKGVTGNESKYHREAPTKMEAADDHLIFTYHRPAASPSQMLKFGIGFPAQYMDQGAIRKKSLGESFANLMGVMFQSDNCGCAFMAAIFFVVFLLPHILRAVMHRRRMKHYLPPSIGIEGAGARRGLTAPEAAIVLELPPDKVMMMILFGLMKKGAVEIKQTKPLQLRPFEIEAGVKLHPYEQSFLEAITKKDGHLSEAKLKGMFIALIRAVNKKLSGFSRKETRQYYRQIVTAAWDQVEKADTPEVGDLFAEKSPWLAMDEDFDKRSERTFRDREIVVFPRWWGHGWGYGRGGAGGGTVGEGGFSIPGANWAHNFTTALSDFSSTAVDSITSFTHSLTKATNPPPVRTSSGGGRSGGGCACACACAGCACACAGGGR